MAGYNDYYKRKDYFGNPYPALMEFFEKAERGTLLDLGAGQGRDSIPLAGMGYSVTAVDCSLIGIEQIQMQSKEVNAVVGDLYSFDVSTFDYVLMDSIIHFYKADIEKESALVRKILNQLKSGAIWVNCLLKNKKSEIVLHGIIDGCGVSVVEEKYIEYPEHNALYHILAVRKKKPILVI